MTEGLLQLRKVTKRFGSVVATDEITLDIGQTEFFALLGPSGSGKTTMLRIIAGLERPDSGRVMIGDTDITHLPPYNRGVGMVFQDFLLFPHKTVAENVSFPLKMQRMEAREKQKQQDWICDLIRLTGLEDRYPHQLSGGQKQRVALARGLVSRPSLLLLDEPLANLDRELRKEMEVEIRRFQIELGIPFVYVTHNQEEALTMSDRMAVMKDGRLEQVGDKFELYHNPATSFIASFLGSPNKFSGTVETVENGQAVISWHGHSLRARAHDGLRSGSKAICYVKSEKIKLGGDEGDLKGTLRDVIFKGQYADYIIDLGGEREITVSAPPALALRPGSNLHLSWRAEDCDAFPVSGA